MHIWQRYYWGLVLLLLIGLGCNLSTAVDDDGAGVATAVATTTIYYDNLPEGNNLNSSMSAYSTISKWGKRNISFYFINGTDQLPGDEEYELVRQAFAIWGEFTNLTFSETTNAANADIEIAWLRGNHGDGDPFDGAGDILAHASVPNPYRERKLELHFDDDERWVNSATQDVDVLTVAIHEIGHTLGLDHSRDENAIMYAAYFGPRRSLSSDDVAGIQALYGERLTENPNTSPPPKAPTPQAPPPESNPEPSQQTDSDGDGISDIEELFKTGTDPNNPDSDGDGISDGLEVQYLMNPLDPDMDNDGISDGDEVKAGTDPFTPEYEGDATAVTDELIEAVGDYLGEAIDIQIEAFASGDASIATYIFTGSVLDDITTRIDDLNSQGLILIADFDYYNSYIDDVQVITDQRVDVSTCEIWYTSTYRLSDDELVSSDGPTLVPQTIVIEEFSDGWYITAVEFYDAPAFCE